jgi:hydrocephalus-inducing protein
LELRVWAFPDVDLKFRDEIIVMVKDNPLPVTIPLVCTGCKTKVEILNNGNLVEFDRLLLN